MDCSLPGPSTHGIFRARVLEWVANVSSQLKPTVTNFKVPNLSGHLVDLSAAQLQPNSMNATGTNLDRREEKAQHHHSALVPSEYAAVCFSLSRALRGSSETQDRARLGSLQDPHRTAPDAVSNIWRFRPPNPRRTRAAHWATSLLARHVPLSPTVRGPVCVASTQLPRPQGEQ